MVSSLAREIVSENHTVAVAAGIDSISGQHASAQVGRRLAGAGGGEGRGEL